MKTLSLLLTLSVVAMFALNTSAENLHDHTATDLKTQTTCPVMGGDIDPSLYADVEGKRIYVCCSECISKIKSDPEKYIKKLEDEGVVLEEVSMKHEMPGNMHSGDSKNHNHKCQ